MNKTVESNTSDVQNSPKKSNRTLWIMIVLFGLPYLAAFYFYINRDTIDLGLTSNFGTIVSPARKLPERTFKTLEGADFLLSNIKDKWTLISVGSASCAEDCQENLYKIRQIKKAVGEDYKRINKLFFLNDMTDIVAFKKLLIDYKGMQVVVPSGEAYEGFLSGFSISGEKVENGIFIVDPLGNYMMAYPPKAAAKGILKDLQRLLKISRIG